MSKHYSTLFLLMILAVAFTSVDAKASFTVATFADPSPDSNHPLFTADFTALTLDGGWSDANTNLTLQIPYSGNNFANAWFDVNGVIALTAVVPNTFYTTGPGRINFYKNNTSTNQLLIIDFDSAVLTLGNFSTDEAVFAAANVRITGSEIIGTLSEEQFSFNFANTLQTSNGFTATASFTSSAVPEPATICLLGLGVLSLINRKSKHNQKLEGKMRSA